MLTAAEQSLERVKQSSERAKQSLEKAEKSLETTIILCMVSTFISGMTVGVTIGKNLAQR